MRTRAERRHNDWRKAKRKFRMDLDTALKWERPNLTIGNKTCYYDKYWLWYDNLHQYSKNKIHCSCGMCSRYHKTNNKGHRRMIHGNYAPSYNPSIRDRRINLHAQAEFDEYIQGDCN